MTTFTLSKEEISKLNSFISHGKDITSSSKYVFAPKDQTLIVAMMGNSFSVRLSLVISDYTSDKQPDELNYFVGDINNIASTASKVLNKSESVKISIEEEAGVTRTRISNPETSTNIALTNYTPISTSEADEVIHAFENDLNSIFSGNKYVITPDIEFMNVMSIICRSMKASGNEVNSALVNKNEVKYCDPQGILTYTLDNNISPYEKDIYIQNTIIDYAKPFMKEGVTLTFEDSNSWVCIESQNAGFVMVLGLESNKFQYPTEDEASYVSPETGSMTSIQVNREQLVEGLKTFDGVFRSELWRWSNIELDSSSEYLSNNQVLLSHSDYNAEASTIIPVQVVENTDATTDNYKFLIGSSYLNDILNLITDDNVIISYTSGEIGEPHGTGYIVEGSKIKVICVKIQKADA